MEKESLKSDIMNLIGYGLAKFDNAFVKEFNLPTKAAFSRYIVQLGLANTEKAVSNRMDSFDPYFENGRRGWFQRNQRDEDARLWGDGYDFQIQCNSDYLLAEVKGLRTYKGSIRMTQNEYNKALEYKNSYILVVVSNLQNTPKLSYIENPSQVISLTPKETNSVQINYYSEILNW